jgi:hypothetical protein
MAVRVAFIENPFSRGGKTISRQVQRDTIDFNKALQYMKLGTAISESEMNTVFDRFYQTLLHFLPEGICVKTNIGIFSMGFRKEKVVAPETGIGPARSVSLAGIDLRIRADRELLRELKAAVKVEVVKAADNLSPTINSVQNTERDGLEGIGAVGEVLHLAGDMLSFAKSDTTIGVFFIPEAGGAEVRATSYSRLGSNILNFKVPALQAGSYRIEVRTKPSGKDIKSGTYGLPFVVS